MKLVPAVRWLACFPPVLPITSRRIPRRPRAASQRIRLPCFLGGTPLFPPPLNKFRILCNLPPPLAIDDYYLFRLDIVEVCQHIHYPGGSLGGTASSLSGVSELPIWTVTGLTSSTGSVPRSRACLLWIIAYGQNYFFNLPEVRTAGIGLYAHLHVQQW